MDDENPRLKNIPHLQELPLASPPPQKRDKKRLVALILLLLVAIGSAVAILVINKDDKSKISNFAECKAAGNPIMESYPERCIANGQNFVNPEQTNTNGQQEHAELDKNDPNAVGYLIINEWGVRIPISESANTQDMVYRYVQNEIYESVFFTFQRLVDVGICKEDVGVAMSRSKSKNSPPYDIENPEQFKEVGGYYYSFAYANGGPCYNPDNQDEATFYEATKITKNTVTDAAKNLEVVPE